MAIYSSPQAAQNLTGSTTSDDSWTAWPGGQANTGFNPGETFTSEDMGFTGNINWDVSTGSIQAVIVETNSTTATGLNKITVRYDNISPSAADTDTVIVKATSGSNTKTKKRTVFRVSVQTINTSTTLHAKNLLRFIEGVQGTINEAGPVTYLDPNSRGFFGKVEVIFNASPVFNSNPNNMNWSKSNIYFKLLTGTSSYPDSPQKGDCVLRRDRNSSYGGVMSDSGSSSRQILEDTVFVIDGGPDRYDAQYPDDSQPEFFFRIDGPGAAIRASDPYSFFYRGDFRECVEIYDGENWKQITPYGEWQANLTGDQPDCTPVAPNNVATGLTPHKIPNNRPTINVMLGNQTVSTNQAVEMRVQVDDLDRDYGGTFIWQQTGGTPVALIYPSPLMHRAQFTAPSGAGILTFQVTYRDDTYGKHRAPSDSESMPATITITVN